MALLDFLKNKKEADKAKEKKEVKIQKASVTPKVAKEKEPKEAKPAKVQAAKISVQAGKFKYNIVKEPHISEKATNLTAANKYTFIVYENANKPEIKKSVEGIYGVNVAHVNLIRIPHKKRRLGRTEGFKKAYNKAVVTIKEGQKIEIF